MSAGSTTSKVKLFWWNTRPNLGDELSRLVLESHGYDVEWAPPKDANWVGVGSILGWFNGFRGTVFGAGRAGTGLPPMDLTQADVRALRGVYTRDLVRGGAEAVLGDPGLLIELAPDPHGYDAIVPHWQDQERMKMFHPDAVFVDVTEKAEVTLPLIAGADRIISSSLHGLVLADALGIPRQWEWFDRVQGRGFKFRDYGSVVGGFDPGEWHTARASLVEAVRSELSECLA